MRDLFVNYSNIIIRHYVSMQSALSRKEKPGRTSSRMYFFYLGNRKYISVQTSVRNYLLTCVRNHCLNFLRRQPTESFEQVIQENIPIYAENNDDFYTLTELQELLAKALNKLPEDYRRVFILNRFEDKSYGEIAESMDISTRTVERYKNKAIELLKKT